MRSTLLIAMTVLLAGTTVQAQNLETVIKLYDQGQWKEAAQKAAALNTSTGYAKAAKYLTAGAGLVAKEEKKALFEQAQTYAKKAISLDKNSAEGYFELARTQGRLAQFAGVVQSLGIAKEMKSNLDQSLKLNPNYASAYVALGLWHANLDSKGFIARSSTGANRNQVVPAFKKAIKLEPKRIIHRLEFANALLLFGKKDSAKKQLEYAQTLPAKTYWEKQELDKIKALLKKIK